MLHSSTTQRSFAVRHRIILGWTSILALIGCYGFYIFHLKSPVQQQRLGEMEQVREKKITLSSLIHQENIENQEGYHTAQAAKRQKALQTAQLSNNAAASAFDPVFQTTTQAAPDEKEVEQETLRSFSSKEAMVLKDATVKKIPVAFRPMQNPKTIELSPEGEEDFSGEVVDEQAADKNNEKAPQFAIQLITSRALYVIEEKWYELKEADKDNLLDELQPKYTVTEISKGKNDYTLLVGPFARVTDALQLCKQLSSITEGCSETLFKGSKLFQYNADEQDFPVGSIDKNDAAPPIR